MGADEDALAALVAARTEALVAGDAERMNDILADDFTYTNASGVSCDRDEYVASYVGSPDLVWLAQESTEPDIRVFGDAAVVRSTCTTGRPGRASPSRAYFRSLFVYVRRDGTWRCVVGPPPDRTPEAWRVRVNRRRPRAVRPTSPLRRRRDSPPP